MWDEQIHKQAQHFETFATQVLQFDTEIIANVAKIKSLRMEHASLKHRHDVVDQSIQQMWDQQEALCRVLTQWQHDLVMPEGRAHESAKVLTVQLDELDRQVEDLARETRTVQSSLYAEPLTTVVRVLDAQASALDDIQAQADAVAQRVRTAEAHMLAS